MTSQQVGGVPRHPPDTIHPSTRRTMSIRTIRVRYYSQTKHSVYNQMVVMKPSADAYSVTEILINFPSVILIIFEVATSSY